MHSIQVGNEEVLIIFSLDEELKDKVSGDMESVLSGNCNVADNMDQIVDSYDSLCSDFGSKLVQYDVSKIKTLHFVMSSDKDFAIAPPALCAIVLALNDERIKMFVDSSDMKAIMHIGRNGYTGAIIDSMNKFLSLYNGKVDESGTFYMSKAGSDKYNKYELQDNGVGIKSVDYDVPYHKIE